MPEHASADSVRSSADPSLQAVFWDMDGTIVDTEPYWIAAEKDLARSFGVEWTEEQAEAMVGQALEFGAGMLREAGVDLPVRAIVERLINRVADQVRQDVPWRPGARELLADLKTAGIPCGMVTMSEPVLAKVIVQSLPAGTFDLVVTGDMVDAGKPHPEAYLQAFETLSRTVPNLHPDRVVAIEDSLPGTASARAAGLVTLGIPNFVPLPAGTVEHEWETLAGRTVADLTRLLPAAVAEPAR